MPTEHQLPTVTLANVEWLDDEQQVQEPCLHIQFNEPEPELIARFCNPEQTIYIPSDIDVFYRQQSTDPPVESGVLGVAERQTGDYILETTTSPSIIEKLVYAVRRYSEKTESEKRYQCRVWAETHHVVTFESDTLLIYGTDGSVLRHQSLIPRNIEI